MFRIGEGSGGQGQGEFRVGGAVSAPAAKVEPPVSAPAPSAVSHEAKAGPRVARPARPAEELEIVKLLRNDTVAPRVARKPLPKTEARPGRDGLAEAFDKLVPTIDGAAWHTATAMAQGQDVGESGVVAAFQGTLASLRAQKQLKLVAKAEERFAKVLDEALDKLVSSRTSARPAQVPAALRQLIDQAVVDLRQMVAYGRTRRNGPGMSFYFSGDNPPYSFLQVRAALEELARTDPASAAVAQGYFESRYGA